MLALDFDTQHSVTVMPNITPSFDGSSDSGSLPILRFSKDFMFFSLAVIIPVGLIFNTISVVVFFSQTMRKRSTSLYLASLAISDNLSLLTLMIDYWLKDPKVGIPIIKQSAILCVAVTHVSYASRMFSALIITSFTIERFIGVVYPLKRATLSSSNHARRVVLTEALVSILATSFTLFTIKIESFAYGHETRLECDVTPDRYKVYVIFNVLFLVGGSIVLPILVICSLNTFILRKICTRRANLICAKHFSKRTRQGYNTATILLSVSTVFVILNIPYCVSWFLTFFYHYGFIPSLGATASDKLFAAKYITKVPYYLNYTINFLLYNICAKTFRQELVHLLCLPQQFYHMKLFTRKKYSPTRGTKRTYLQDSSHEHGHQVCSRVLVGHHCKVLICDNGQAKYSVTL